MSEKQRKLVKTPTELAADLILKRYRSINPKPPGYGASISVRRNKSKTKRGTSILQPQNYTISSNLPRLMPISGFPYKPLRKDMLHNIPPSQEVVYRTEPQEGIAKEPKKNKKLPKKLSNVIPKVDAIKTLVVSGASDKTMTGSVGISTLSTSKPCSTIDKKTEDHTQLFEEALKDTIAEKSDISSAHTKVMLSPLELHKEILDVIPEPNTLVSSKALAPPLCSVPSASNTSLVQTIVSAACVPYVSSSVTNLDITGLVDGLSPTSRRQSISAHNKIIAPVPAIRGKFRPSSSIDIRATATIPGIAASASVRGILPQFRPSSFIDIRATATIPGIPASASVRGIFPPFRSPVAIRPVTSVYGIPPTTLIRGIMPSSPIITSVRSMLPSVSAYGMVPSSPMIHGVVSNTPMPSMLMKQSHGQNIITAVPMQHMIQLPGPAPQNLFVNHGGNPMIIPRYQGSAEKPLLISAPPHPLYGATN